MKSLLISVVSALVGVVAGQLISEDHVRCLRRYLHLEPKPKEVPSISKYAKKKTPDLIKDEARKAGLNIDQIDLYDDPTFCDDLTINDLEIMCYRTYYPSWSREKVSSVLREARSVAFTAKYATPNDEDEKTVDVKKLGIPNLRSWYEYFEDLIHDLGMSELKSVEILDVGFGNGYAYSKLFHELHSFTAVDISLKALEYATDKFPRLKASQNDAENLKDIQTSSIDLYISLRTYQSTLFDKRMAMHEAYRVLRTGGLAIISIPIMFMGSGGEVLHGLIPPGLTNAPDMNYAHEMVNRVEHLFRVLNFRDIGTNTSSPFEIYVYGWR